LLHNVEFVAGVNGTRFVANSGSVEVLEHPVWRQASGARKFRYDVAVVRLSRPIARGRVQPLRIYSEDQVLPKRGALVGYRGPRAIALHGRFDCALSSLTSFGLFASDCQVSGGNSGGAVLAQGNDGWELAGVIVASTRPKSMAVVVELDDWLRQQVTNALQREARQLMDIQSLSRTPGPLGL
jgi:hypothetical protein